MSEALRELRSASIGSYLWSGDGNDLINVEPEDLGLPASTRSAEVLRLTYDNHIKEVGHEVRASGEFLVEYECQYHVRFRATMTADDAQANGWGGGVAGAALVDAEGEVEMLARLGAVFESEDDPGGVEYIGLTRSDGTPPSPINGGGGDARVYEFRRPSHS